jgi:DNA repair protein RecO (recombination protein O)
MGSRTVRAEAVVLRSLRYGEADRILHLFTRDQGRCGAIAKGARRTKSRFGARLEPFTHVELLLHRGRGELGTISGAELVRSHQTLALDSYRLAVGHVGVEAVLRLFIEHDANPQAFHALVRFLDLLDGPVDARAQRAALDPLALSFQLKLLWLAGYLPHLACCSSCSEPGPLVAFSSAAGGAVCAECRTDALTVSADGFEGIRALLERPLADSRAAGLTNGAAQETLAVIESVYAYHGGFRMRTLARR